MWREKGELLILIEISTFHSTLGGIDIRLDSNRDPLLSSGICIRVPEYVMQPCDTEPIRFQEIESALTTAGVNMLMTVRDQLELSDKRTPGVIILRKLMMKVYNSP